jgi:site-specific DNA recombinase
MKKAILYIRVSTDEQADKGYSQRNQDEVLHKYCVLRSIGVHDVVYEDHSAKTFNRPAWVKMFNGLKKAKGKEPVDFILFTKWDRFSRNTADAYQMIALLRKLGSEPQAIEQPLDLSVPENKMMLAFYLAVPEVENDRRALNIFHGIRRARKEGRWTTIAPVGYINRTTEEGRKYIRPNEPQAGIMKRAFAELATGRTVVEQVWKKAKKEGLSCGRNNFWNMVRNPVYCGKIVVHPFQDETRQLVEGQHEALISDELFNQVQQILDGRKRTKGTKLISPEMLPLRGYLSDHLLSEGYKDAAAVMIGSTLEEHIRQLCTTHNVDTQFTKGDEFVNKKAEVMNADLKKLEVYSSLEQKQVTAWLGIRNSAAHGKYTEYRIEQVQLMYSGVLDFIARIK